MGRRPRTAAPSGTGDRAERSPTVAGRGMSELTHDASDRYPEFALTDEARRRWRLVTYSATVIYGFQGGEAMSGSDRMVVEFARRSLFESDLPSRDGDLRDDQRGWLVDSGLL
jgi:hypothetical protein